MTDYVVLVYEPTDGTEGRPGVWREYGGSLASSPARALRNLKTEAGTYVAVPARSWKALTVKVEQTTKVTIG